MDQLLLALKEVSQDVLPIAGVVALILLAVFLVHLTKIVKRLNGTLEKLDAVLVQADALVDNVDHKVSQLEGPLGTLDNVSKTVDSVNNSAIGAVSSIMQFSSQYSDSIVDWFSGMKDKKKSHPATEDDTQQKTEDFGVYE